jgi:hypothetical protein
VDREGRARALIASSRSRAAARLRFVLLLSSVALLAASLSGCRNRQEEARQKAELTKTLDQFKAHVGDLQKQAAEMRSRFDKLPEDLPGIDPVRDDLHALEEGLGVEGGRAQWLAGQLDKAFASGKRDEIDAVKSAIPQGDLGLEPVIVRVAHKLSALERLMAQRRFFEKLDAENAAKAAAEAAAQKEKPPKARSKAR